MRVGVASSRGGRRQRGEERKENERHPKGIVVAAWMKEGCIDSSCLVDKIWWSGDAVTLGATDTVDGKIFLGRPLSLALLKTLSGLQQEKELHQREPWYR